MLDLRKEQKMLTWRQKTTQNRSYWLMHKHTRTIVLLSKHLRFKSSVFHYYFIRQSRVSRAQSDCSCEYEKSSEGPLKTWFLWRSSTHFGDVSDNKLIWDFVCQSFIQLTCVTQLKDAKHRIRLRLNHSRCQSSETHQHIYHHSKWK